jgi:hypothetical protein
MISNHDQVKGSLDLGCFLEGSSLLASETKANGPTLFGSQVTFYLGPKMI